MKSVTDATNIVVSRGHSLPTPMVGRPTWTLQTAVASNAATELYVTTAPGAGLVAGDLLLMGTVDTYTDTSDGSGKSTEVVISFRPPAANLFRQLPGMNGGKGLVPNRIVMEIAPRESIRVRFESQVPGLEFKLDSLEMDSDFQERFKVEEVEAYGPLIIDAMRGVTRRSSSTGTKSRGPGKR